MSGGNEDTKVLIEEVKRLVTPVPERRNLELLSTFIAAVAHSFEEVVSESMVPGVVNSVARMFAKQMWPTLGEPKSVKELLERVHEAFPASFENYIMPEYFVVRDCPIRDVVERENLRPGWSLCLFARGILWYFLQKAVSPKAKVDIVKPGYKACLCKLSNAKVEGKLNMRGMDYEEFVTKSEEFFVVLLKGLTSALYKILGEPAKGYLVTAGKFAGYAHSSALPLVDDDWNAAMELLSNFLLIWKGQVKLGDGALVLEEEKYEFVVPKDDLICHLFYGYVAGLLSGVTGKNVNFDDYGCGNKKVIQVE